MTGFRRSLKRAVRKSFRVLGIEVSRAARRPASSRRSHAGRRPSPHQQGSQENLYDAVDFVRNLAVRDANAGLRAQIAAEVAGGRAPHVGFLVSDRTKWNGDSLLREIDAAGWRATLYLTPKQASYADGDDRRAAYQQEREFFGQVHEELVDLYDWKDDRPVPVEDSVRSDVVFLQQPWGMQDFPKRLLGRALSAYMHYGFVLMGNHGQHYHIGGFHPYLWRYFTQTEEHRLLHLQHDAAAYDKLVVTGYPKFDAFFDEPHHGADQLWPLGHAAGKRIVYAPHHSLTPGSLGMSTFGWNHRFMLELAQRTPNVQWIYKPHPNMPYAVARAKLMSRSEYDEYLSEWRRLPHAEVYDSGRYLDLFRTSDALITDCGSFLAEYLPTGKPIIWLVSPNSVGFNSVGNLLSEAFYDVRTLDELRTVFEKVVVRGEDPLYQRREQSARLLFPTQGRAATAILEHLREQLTADRRGSRP